VRELKFLWRVFRAVKLRSHLGQTGRAWWRHWTAFVFSSICSGNDRNESDILSSMLVEDDVLDASWMRFVVEVPTR